MIISHFPQVISRTKTHRRSMNHQWSEDVTFVDKGEEVPQFQGQENSGTLPQMMSSSSCDAALGAKNVNFQLEGQHPSGFSGQDAGAEGNLRKYPSGFSGQDAGAEGNLRKLLGQESQKGQRHDDKFFCITICSRAAGWQKPHVGYRTKRCEESRRTTGS